MTSCPTAHLTRTTLTDWISPVNWEQALANLRFLSRLNSFGAYRQRPASAGSRRRAEPCRDCARQTATDAQPNANRLLVTGFVTPQGVDLGYVGPQIGPAPPAGSSADSFTLRALGSHGQVLASIPMAASTGGHIDPGPGGRPGSPLVGISGDVPAAGVDSIQIADSGKLVATEARPPHPPRARILAPRRGARVVDATGCSSAGGPPIPDTTR